MPGLDLVTEDELELLGVLFLEGRDDCRAQGLVNLSTKGTNLIVVC